jgi:hypothetical protein
MVKNNFNMKKLSLLLCVILFMTVSCHKPKLVGEFYLTAKTKELNPFSGYEKLTFKDDTGPDEILEGDARINNIIKAYIGDESGDFVLWEQDYSRFVNDQYEINITLSTYLEEPYLSIHFKDFVDGYTIYSGFKIRDDSIIGRYYDSILIHQVWYHHIYYDTMKYQTHPFPADIQRFPVKSYYSATSGVVKIDFSDDSFLELDKIEWTE